MDLADYSPEHEQELHELLSSRSWRRVLASDLVDTVERDRLEPGTPRAFVDTVLDQLLDVNRARVDAQIRAGETNVDRLVEGLAAWPERFVDDSPVLSFVGINLTTDCNFQPRCIYCNQPRVEATVDLDGWKRIVDEVTARGDDRAGPYLYLTGGEPLMLSEELWGDDGLIRYATARGARVNVNTNASMITPEVALAMIKAGLGILHISLDAASGELQDDLFGGSEGRSSKVLRGIYNVQLARELVGVAYPAIHTNCVLTNRNLEAFPKLFRFLLDKHKHVTKRENPFFNDLLPHIIPVGGDNNVGLRPSEEEFGRFYREVWDEVGRVWQDYQVEIGIPEDKRGPLLNYFSNPYLRVEHEGGLEAYLAVARDGRYGRLALSRHCYVAPTQAVFTADGHQHRCGSHAVRRILPIGTVGKHSVFESIELGLAGLEQLPTKDDCYGCPLATLYINQSVEAKLRAEVKSMLEQADQS